MDFREETRMPKGNNQWSTNFVRKIAKVHGQTNSLHVVPPKVMLDELGIGDGDSVEFEVNRRNDTLVMRKVKVDKRKNRDAV